MIETTIMRVGQSSRFYQRRRGPFEAIALHDNNTIRVIDGDGHEAVINIERCTKVTRRPQHLVYDTGLDTIIESVIRGPDFIEVEGDECPRSHTENLENEIGHEPEIQLRRSNRLRRQPDHFAYCAIDSEWEMTSHWDMDIAAELSTLFSDFEPQT